MEMPEIMNRHHLPQSGFQQMVSTNTTPPRNNVFPEYLKHTELLGENNSQIKLNGPNTLFHAVLKGQLRNVRLLLDRGVSANSSNDYGHSVLTAALHVDESRRRHRLFRLLLKRGADPQVKDAGCNRSALHWACLLGRTEEVKTLLKEVYGELDLRDKDSDSRTALHTAVIAGHLDIVKLLVDVHRKLGVTVDLADSIGLTPYLHAKRMGYRDIAEYLQGHGRASMGHADRLFRTPREWSQIGKFERQESVKIHTLEAINFAKIQGKITQVRHLARLGVSLPQHGDAVPHITSTTASPNGHPDVRHAGPRRYKGFHSDRLSTSLPSLQEHGLQGYRHRPFSSNGHSEDVVDSSTNIGNINIPIDIHVRPPKEAFAATSNFSGTGPTGRPMIPRANIDTSGVGNIEALHLMEMNEKSRHVRTYRHSQFDETKASEYKQMLGNLMEVLADQQSSSFRKSVKYQKPDTPKKVKQKSKVSTLALIFGRDKGGSRGKKYKGIDRSRSPKVSASMGKGDHKGSSKKEKGADSARNDKGAASARKDKGEPTPPEAPSAPSKPNDQKTTTAAESSGRRRTVVPLLKVNDKVV